MVPSELTVEAGKNFFRTANLKPSSGEYYSEVYNCGCLIGAMFFSVHSREKFNTIFDPASEVENLYGLPMSSGGTLINGFDYGFDNPDCTIDSTFRAENEWYVAAFHIGQAMRKEIDRESGRLDT